MQSLVTAASIVGSRSFATGESGLDVAAEVDPVIVGVVVVTALVGILAWANVADAGAEDRELYERLRGTLLGAMLPLFLVFLGVLTVQVLGLL